MPAGVAGSCVMTVSRMSFRKVGWEAGGSDGENGMGGRSRWPHNCGEVAKRWSTALGIAMLFCTKFFLEEVRGRDKRHISVSRRPKNFELEL